MRNFLFAAAAILALGGCAQLQSDWAALNGTTVSPQAVYIAANAFDAVEQTATNYLRLPACSGSNGPVCRNATAVKQIVPLVRSGRVARKKLEAAIRDPSGAPVAPSLLQTLEQLTGSLKTILAEWGQSG
jgi:hypothetical protein